MDPAIEYEIFPPQLVAVKINDTSPETTQPMRSAI
jgi:hypothetical protein